MRDIRRRLRRLEPKPPQPQMARTLVIHGGETVEEALAYYRQHGPNARRDRLTIEEWRCIAAWHAKQSRAISEAPIATNEKDDDSDRWKHIRANS